MALRDERRDLLPRDDERAAWQPEIFDPARPDEWKALQTLLRGGRVRQLHDTIEDQLAELAETRLPRPADAARRPALAAELRGGRDPDHFGRWVFYPWSGRLVHLLPEAEFRELRTSRNAYKITPQEQAKLRSLRLGIVGLSVGHATAVTLALEEIGGEYRLADFDTLSLSNMNRLHARVDSVGMPKAVLTAREIFEINPYARIRLFPKGIDDHNVDAFLTEGGKLDLLFEECDDLFMKVFLRERARALRIPTLMETSDRGLIDVERFDLEPGRALLHGLIGTVRAEQLRGLPTADKVPFVLEIVGFTTTSPRFAGSLYEIDRTIRTWPQLASGVALGGSLNTDAARRIALGQFHESGRYYVDLEQIINDGRSAVPHPSPPLPRVETPTPAPPALRPVRRVGESEARQLVQLATLAPSGGNSQPWRFELRGGELLVRLPQGVFRSVLDFEQRGGILSIGAAVENLRIAAAAAGLGIHVEPFPDPADPALVARIGFGSATDTRAGEAFGPMSARVTNRRLAQPQPITQQQRDALARVAEQAGVNLSLVTARDELTEIAHILGAGDRIRYINEAYGTEAAHELRWSGEEVLSTRTGLDVRSLELSPTDLAAARLSGTRNGLDLLQKLGLGSALEEGAWKSFAGASGAMIVSVPGHGAHVHFAGGRAVEALWIAAESVGLAVQPYTALLYMFLRNELGDASAFTPEQRAELTELRRRLRRVSPEPRDHTAVMLLRLSHAPPPAVRSLRRPVEDVFTIAR